MGTFSGQIKYSVYFHHLICDIDLLKYWNISESNDNILLISVIQKLQL